MQLYQGEFLTFRACLIMQTASRNSCLLIKEFDICVQKDSILFYSLSTNGFWFSIHDFAIVSFTPDRICNLGQKLVHDKSISLHLRFKLNTGYKIFLRSLLLLGSKMFLLTLLSLLNLWPLLHKLNATSLHFFVIITGWGIVAALIKCLDMSFEWEPCLLTFLL